MSEGGASPMDRYASDSYWLAEVFSGVDSRWEQREPPAGYTLTVKCPAGRGEEVAGNTMCYGGSTCLSTPAAGQLWS